MLMKHLNRLCMAAVMLLVPFSVPAQSTIEKYFDDFRTSGVTILKTRHQKNMDDRNPNNTGWIDYYEFTVKKGGKKVVDAVMAAFNGAAAESYENYTRDGIGPARKARIYYNLNDYIDVGQSYPNYGYMCFADPTKKDFRTIYVFEWGYKDSRHNKLVGRFFRAYSKRPSKLSTPSTVRMYTNKGKSGSVTNLRIGDIPLDSLDILVNGMNTDSLTAQIDLSAESLLQLMGTTKQTSTNWLASFNIYRTRYLHKPNDTAANIFVNKIYELCKNAACLSGSEKQVVAGELQKMMGKSKDSFHDSLLNMAIEALKQ